MDSSQVDQADKSSPETCSDSSLSPDSPDSNDIYGEPLVHPRVGDEYQVEIPFMLNKSELLQLMMNPVDSESVKDSSLSFFMGLPMPVMWIYNQENVTKKITKAIDNTHAIYANGIIKSEKNEGMSHISSVEEEPKIKVDSPNQTSCLVPGQSSASWSDFEADCFLLGLYIFGKNLLLVARLMESKGVGQILSYYYGQFYGSTGYRRWSECRKMRNRKCVLGHRFFTGYRQNELFARLAPRLSEESKTKYLEVSRAFVEGRTTLEEYVFSLKALVGIHSLVEAVGIGKGKDDLSTLVLDGAKNSQLFSQRPEIPSGKACSSLTCDEIVKYLTGDFRLSKARSNDLFWEAVWPRLLARGWHSEQPHGDNYAGSKSCLVFLMPGIKKFSRRKLSKGDHYFNSISDVLAKVAGEPELLELEADETTPSSSKVENGWAIEVKSDDEQDLSDQERHCYLKPRVSSGISNLLKFTVVDTSLANEDYPSKVRELRSLPHEARRCSSFRKNHSGMEVNAGTMRNGLQSSTTFAHSEIGRNTDGTSERLPGSHNFMYQEKPADANLPKDHKSRTIKHQFSRRVKPGLTSCSSGQVTKRRRFASSPGAGVTYVLCLPARSYKIKLKGKSAAASKVMMTNNSVTSKVTQSDNVKEKSTKTLVGGSSNFSSDVPREKENLRYKIKIKGKNAGVSKVTVTNNSVPPKATKSDDVKEVSTKTLVGGTSDFSSDVSREKENLVQRPKLIDLNLPHVEPESDDKVKLEVEAESCVKVKLGGKNSAFQLPNSQKPENSDAKDQLVSCATVDPTNKGGETLDQLQPRRQSTRNRPLTTKALEALEVGLSNSERHSRKRSPSTSQEQKPKRSRQPRKGSMFSPVVDFKVREAADEKGKGKTSETLGKTVSVEKAATACDFRVLPETSVGPTASSK